MADNIDISPGAGATVATDQVAAGRHYQRFKLTDEAEGSENHASVRADGTQEVSLADLNAALYAILEAITHPISQDPDGARDVLAGEVDRLYGMFVDAVARRRSANAQAVCGTEAGILYGEDSVARGFADRVGTFREALAAMTASVSKPKFTKGNTTVSEATQAATTPPIPDLAAIEAEARQQGYAEAAEIVVLCNIAGRPALGDVRKQLLTLRAEADQEEIRSHVLPETGTTANSNLDENPVVKACAALAAGPKGAK